MASTLTKPLNQPSTRERLLSASLPMIASHGFHGTSVRRLCQAVGIREASFYAHFKSKEEMFQVLLDRAGASVPRRILAELRAASLPASEFVSLLVNRLLHAWSREEARQQRVLLETEAARSPRFRTRFNQGVAAVIDEVASDLRRYQEGGEIREDVEEQALAWSLVAPLAALRSTFLAPGASKRDRQRAGAIAERHRALWVETFINRRRKRK